MNINLMDNQFTFMMSLLMISLLLVTNGIYVRLTYGKKDLNREMEFFPEKAKFPREK